MLMIAAGYEDGNDADALRRGSSGKAGVVDSFDSIINIWILL